MPNDLLLHAESLSIRSDDALLVDNISFRIGRERVALVGESGSGKSLTARADGTALARAAPSRAEA